MLKTKIVIYGAGAVGLVMSVALSQNSNNEVFIHARPASLQIIAKKGIKIDGKATISFSPQIFDPNKLSEKILFILTVKAYDLVNAIEELLPILSPESVILLVQNGYGIKEIALEVLNKLDFPVQVFQAISAVGATLNSPGNASYFGGGLRIEENFNTTTFKNIWENSFLKVLPSQDFKTEIWRKLVINCVVNPLTALLNLSNHELSKKEYNSLKEQILEESLSIATASGFTIILSIEKLNDFIDSENISSMLQDFRKGSQTEINFINGALVKQANKLNISAPLNQLLTSLILAKTINKQEIK